MSAKHNEWHHNMPRHEGHCPTCNSATPFGMVIPDPTSALRARCARLEGALLEMLHWFGRYPEFIPSNENDETPEHVAAAIARARGAVGP